MHQNYYFLRQLADALRPQVVGLKFMEAFSQDKDEFIVVLAHARGKNNFYRPFFLRATLRPDFACLNFPEAFNRARTNSANLFEPLLDLTVTGVRSFLNERAIALEIENGYSLVFKLFGNRSNAVLFHQGEVIDIFNTKLAADNQLNLATLDRPLDQTYEAYLAAQCDHRKLFPTFGKVLNAYLEAHFTANSDLNPAQKWAFIQEAIGSSGVFYVSEHNYQPTLSLLPMGKVWRKHTDPIAAVNDFYNNYGRTSNIAQEKGEALRLLQKRILRTETYVNETLEKLLKIDEGVKNDELGHILMANLHQIPDRVEQVALFDFYRNQTISIKIKADLSPQKNAENYYRKSKNERIEIEKLQENISLREAELVEMRAQLAQIVATENLKELRKYLKVNQILNQTTAQTPAQLFKWVEFEGYVILIGKNAKNNDLLTKKFAHKDDLWLHARDVSGSHVVVKFKAGRKIPNSVVERAAQLAAWNSKRRGETLCPVIVTPKKFVRKPKGLPEGAVVIDKESVVMVEPKG